MCVPKVCFFTRKVYIAQKLPVFYDSCIVFHYESFAMNPGVI